MTNAELKELVHLLMICGIMDKTALESENVTNEEWLQMKSLIEKYQAEKTEPEVHGDLISRSALKEAMRKAKKGHYSAFSDVTLQSIYKVIDNAPTVIDHSRELGHNVGYFVNDDYYRKYYE